MSVTVNGTNGLTFNDASSQNTAATGFGFKNRIINGAMVIDQRNAGASVTPSSGNYTLDRWKYQATQSSKVTIEQTVTGVSAPVGFTDYLAVTSSSAYSVTSTDEFEITQPIEGFNTADLAWGTASAQAVTVSFWVRSSLTGTFGGAIGNNAFNRSYPISYTINAANTWEQKTVTIAGDTSGTWVGATNGIGLYLYLALGAGSTKSGTAGSWSGNYYVSATGATSVVGTNGATFYITGVQLEKGSTATSFDYRPYGTELQLCQRYLPALNGNTFTLNGYTYNSNANLYVFNFPVTARVAATGITVSSVSHFRAYNGSNTSQAPSTMSFDTSNPQMGGFTTTQASGFTIAQPSRIESNNASALLLFTGCEL
jgi:hypothetical protein